LGISTSSGIVGFGDFGGEGLEGWSLAGGGDGEMGYGVEGSLAGCDEGGLGCRGEGGRLSGCDGDGGLACGSE